MNWAPTRRHVGNVALLFAACLILESILIAIVASAPIPKDARRSPFVSMDAGPLAWSLVPIAIAVMLPWIVAGIMQLKRAKVGHWLPFALTLPTAPFVLMCLGGALYGFGGLWAGSAGKDAIPYLFICGPPAFFGLMFCLTVWWFQCIYWQRLTSARVAVQQLRSRRLPKL